MKEKIVWKIGKYRVRLDTVVFVLGIAGILLIGLSSWLPAGGGGEKHTGVQEADAKAYSAQLEERLLELQDTLCSANSAIELTIPELERFSGHAAWVDVCKGWQDQPPAGEG